MKTLLTSFLLFVLFNLNAQIIDVNLDQNGQATINEDFILNSGVLDSCLNSFEGILTSVNFESICVNDSVFASPTIILGGTPPYRHLNWVTVSGDTLLTRVNTSTSNPITPPSFFEALRLGIGDHLLIVVDDAGCEHRNPFTVDCSDLSRSIMQNSGPSTDCLISSRVSSISFSQQSFDESDIGIQTIVATVNRPNGFSPFECSFQVNVIRTENIPTLGEWGLINLSLILCIFGIQGVKQNERCVA